MDFLKWLVLALVLVGCDRLTGRWDNPTDPLGDNYFPPQLVLTQDLDSAWVGLANGFALGVQDSNSTRLALVIQGGDWVDTVSLFSAESWESEQTVHLLTKHITTSQDTLLILRVLDEDGLFSPAESLKVHVLDSLGGSWADTLLDYGEHLVLPRLPQVAQNIVWTCADQKLSPVDGQWEWVAPWQTKQVECIVEYELERIQRADTLGIRVESFAPLRLAVDSGPAILYQAPIRWTKGLAQDSFALWISQNDNSFVKIAWTTADSALISSLQLDQKYRIYVQAWGRNRTVYSDTLSFATSKAPGMAHLPTGTYLRGSELGDLDESPVRSRTVQSIWMDTLEVGGAEFANLVPGARGASCVNCPAHYVRWTDAVLYANALSKKYKLDTAYTYTAKSGGTLQNLALRSNIKAFHLPSEDEWEYAARATSNEAWIWGSANDSTIASQYAWWSATGLSARGLRKANAWGLYDMAGNVWEWTYDGYAPYEGSSFVPDSAAAGAKVIRGAGWRESDLRALRVSNRQYMNPLASSDNVGFRLVLP